MKGRRVDALGKWDVAKTREGNHTELEDYVRWKVVWKSLKYLAAWRSRMRSCECEERESVLVSSVKH